MGARQPKPRPPERRLSPEAEAELWAGVAYSEEFFMEQAAVQKALAKLTGLLEQSGIPYAVIGAMALNEYGHRRVTVDVDVLLTADGLARFKERHLGREYLEKFPGSRGLRDTEHGVNVDVVLAGQFPGDGNPKPVSFPNPEEVAERSGSMALLPLKTFLDLKLASGMTAPHRIQDLADVVALIRARKLPRELVEELSPYVHAKFLELWEAAQTVDRLQE